MSMTTTRCHGHLLAATLLLLVCPLLFAGSIEPGHSAAWYHPDRDGEGWMLELNEDDRALVTWFTYDEHGRQRWLIGEGEVIRGTDGEGDEIVFPTLYAPRGGRFGPDYQPDEVHREAVGSAIFRFSDCDHGQVAYAAFDQTGVIDLYRLSSTMAAGCQPIHGVTGQPVAAHAGQSGTWFDSGYDGQGWQLQWLADGQALLTWYTYDAQGNPYWLIGTGQADGGRIVFEQMHSTQGGRFGAAYDPREVQRIDWGRLELALDCQAGTAHYQSPLDGFGSGSFSDVQRLSWLAQPACPWQAPTLTDLYRFELVEIPVHEPAGHDNAMVQGLADDGTVIATQPVEDGIRLLYWRPGMPQMAGIPLDRTYYPSSNRFFVSSDAQVVATTVQGLTPETWPVYTPVIGTLDGQWTHLDEPTFIDTSIVYGMSRDGSRLVGSGLLSVSESRGWIWDAEQGQQVLPLSESMLGAVATGTSDDGRVVIGYQFDNTNYGQPDGVVRRFATRWFDGEPEILVDTHTHPLRRPYSSSADGRIIIGSLQGGDFNAAHPQLDQAWYWTEQSGAVYLGLAPDAMDTSPYYAVAVSAEGNLIAGYYVAELDDGVWAERPFIWTQATGLTAIGAILAQQGLDDGDWRSMGPVGISSDGDLMLLTGFRDDNSETRRAALLRLIPRELGD